MPSFSPGDGFIRLGDATSHGGKVITASADPGHLVHGLPIACIGDKVSCPHHGVNSIVESWSRMYIRGRLVAVHGCKSACGASIISSMQGIHAIGQPMSDEHMQANGVRQSSSNTPQDQLLKQDKVFAKSISVGATTDPGTSLEHASNFGLTSLLTGGALRPGWQGLLESQLSRTAGQSLFTRVLSASPWTLTALAVMPTQMGDGTLYSHDELRQTSMAKSRVRFYMGDNADTSQLEVAGIHTRPGEAIEMVPVVHAYADGENFVAEHEGIRFTWRPDQSGMLDSPTSAYPADPGIDPQTINVTPIDTGEGASTMLPIYAPDSRDIIITFPTDDVAPLYLVYRVPDVDILEVGPYSDLSKRSRRDGMDADHIPSQGALKKSLRDRYPGINPQIVKELLKQAPSAIIPASVHRGYSETYGGRNSPARVETDASDLLEALNRNVDAIKPGLLDHGLSETRIESMRTELQDLLKEQGWIE